MGNENEKLNDQDGDMSSYNIALRHYGGEGFSKALIILFSEVLMYICIRLFTFRNTQKKNKHQKKNLTKKANLFKALSHSQTRTSNKPK